MDGGADVETTQEYVGTIVTEGKRLRELIDDILDLTKMEAGKVTYEFQEFALNEIVETVLLGMHSRAEAKKQELVADLQPDLGEVRVAQDRITQVLTNFMSNAIKYTPEGGRIVVHTRKTPPFPGQAVPTVTVTVEDNGIGIAPENLERVFSKFDRIEAIANHKEGTGLGMAISKQIVEGGHGGRIGVESEVGKGSKFHFRIPVA